MTTIDEIKQCKYSIIDIEYKVSARTSREEVDALFSGDIALKEKVAEVIDDYVYENNLKPKYERLSELLQMNEKTIKQCLARGGTSNRITRPFLYKLVVGLKLSLEQANELFSISGGGVLKSDCIEDLVCINAIRDKDDIKEFIKEYNKYTRGKIMSTLSY